MRGLQLGNRGVGPDHPPYVIAEIGSNHNGDLDLCRRLIDSVKECGADAVKFQSWSESSLLSKDVFERGGVVPGASEELRQAVRHYQLSPAQHDRIRDYCIEKDITFVSSAFSQEEVDLLDGLDVPFFKIASMDINNLRLLSYVAGKERPVLLSTGMATLGEIERAVETLRTSGNDDIVLLHCVSLYPARAEQINLRNMELLRESFDLPVGFSDHTLGVAAALGAIALGSCVVEKHFTLDREMEGWDHAVSAEPAELGRIVSEGQMIWKALGQKQRRLGREEREQRQVYRRSLVTARAMKEGETIGEDDITMKRPGDGIRPDALEYVVGRRLSVSMEEDRVLRWEHLA